MCTSQGRSQFKSTFLSRGQSPQKHQIDYRLRSIKLFAALCGILRIPFKCFSSCATRHLCGSTFTIRARFPSLENLSPKYQAFLISASWAASKYQPFNISLLGTYLQNAACRLSCHRQCTVPLVQEVHDALNAACKQAWQ